MRIEKYLRRPAYGIIVHRDGYRNLLMRKREFHVFSAQDYEIQQIESRKKLERLVKYAFNNSPYYREQGEKIGIGFNNTKLQEEIDRLPMLTKSIIEKK
jgi:phenylacetate-coenzyme A ligase PaaK-like adenylate-forming protein